MDYFRYNLSSDFSTPEPSRSQVRPAPYPAGHDCPSLSCLTDMESPSHVRIAPGDIYPSECSTFNPKNYISNHPLAPPEGPRSSLGPTGPPGSPGCTGPPGIRGPKGDQGECGIQGPEGPEGMPGPRGGQGPAGLQGATGPPGLRGECGHEGPRGEQGPAGLQGIQGLQGKTGPPGPKGDPGEMGRCVCEGRDGHGLAEAIIVVTGDYQIRPNDRYIVIKSPIPRTLTLYPLPSGHAVTDALYETRSVHIRALVSAGAHKIVINTQGNTINEGQSFYSLPSHQTVKLVPWGSTWYTF
jgi:hypothetical protein